MGRTGPAGTPHRFLRPKHSGARVPGGTLGA